MKKLLLMLLGVLMTFPMLARDFEYTYEGQTLTYTVISEDDRTCMTKEGGVTAGNLVENDLVIPAVAIDVNGNEYNVIEIGGSAFRGCSSLSSVSIPGSVTTIERYAFEGCSSLSSVSIPGLVTTIERYAFSGCSSLSSITIPGSVTTIGEGAFYDCSSLSSVDIPGSVTTIREYAFFRCSSLSSVSIPGSVTTIGGYAFSVCSSLSSVFIPGSVTEIGWGAFGSCINLIEILADENNQCYCSIDGVLFDKEQTKLIQFPGGKSGDYTIPGSVTTIWECAFMGCSSLSSVDIPGSVTTIGNGAFMGCSSLSSVSLSGSVTAIEGYAFEGCSSLSSVSLPGSVTAIEGYAFERCSSLSSVSIPGSVTTIGRRVFQGCSSLNSVYYNAQEPVEAGRDVFDNYENATLYVPAAAIEKCKQIDPWKNFKSIEAYEFTGINDVATDIDGDVPCEVYTVSGVKVGDSADDLAPGIYIVRQGNAVKKIAVN